MSDMDKAFRCFMIAEIFLGIAAVCLLIAAVSLVLRAILALT